jgi:hypothetical protein
MRFGIPELTATANVATSEILAKAPLIGASSNAWRKKRCEQRASLNNVVALLSERALFNDTVNCSGMRKDWEAIAQLLATSAESLLGEDKYKEKRVVGWVLDNTKAQLEGDACAARKIPQVDHGRALRPWHCTFNEGFLQI